MHTHRSPILGVLALASASLGLRLPGSSPSVSTVLQLETVGSWFENLAIQSSGTILATRLDTPEIWTVDPFARTGGKLLSIPGFSGILGIAEIKEGVFIVSTENFSLTGGPDLGTAHVYEVDLRHKSPTTRELAHLPEAGLLNGVTKWDNRNILIADSFCGMIYKLDVVTGRYSVAISDDTMTIPAGAQLQVGVNGVKAFRGFVYYTCTARQILARVPVDHSAKPTGPPQIIASGFLPDDFTIRDDATAYVATNAQNTIVKVTPGGNISTVAGSLGSLELASATATEFGRTKLDSNTLYVSTAGGLGSPVNVTLVNPAAIVAVNLCSRGYKCRGGTVAGKWRGFTFYSYLMYDSPKLPWSSWVDGWSRFLKCFYFSRNPNSYNC